MAALGETTVAGYAILFMLVLDIGGIEIFRFAAFPTCLFAAPLVVIFLKRGSRFKLIDEVAEPSASDCFITGH